MDKDTPADATPEEWAAAVRFTFATARSLSSLQSIPSHWLETMRDKALAAGGAQQAPEGPTQKRGVESLDFEALWAEAQRKAAASGGDLRREFALAVLAAAPEPHLPQPEEALDAWMVEAERLADAYANIASTNAEESIACGTYDVKAEDAARAALLAHLRTRPAPKEVQQEPVAWLNPNGQLRHRKYLETDRPLVYAAPVHPPPNERIDGSGVDSVDAPSYFDKPLTHCAAGSDGDCTHPQCPQIRDGEPTKTGRHCPIDNREDSYT